MHAFARAVENEHQAPLGREGEASDDGRGGIPSGAAAVDHEAALLEEPESQTGPRSPAEHACNLEAAGIEIEEPRHADSDAERELRSGSESGVRGDRFLNVDVNARRQVEVLRQRVRVADRARRIRSLRSHSGRGGETNPGEGAFQREAQAAVAAAQAAVQIDETHVQPGRCMNANAALGPARHA